MDLTHKIVRRLLRDDEVEFSRNKNFEAYEDPRVKRALRIYRHLLSVEADLLEAGPDGGVELEAVERNKGRVVVRLTFADGRGRRISYVSPREWSLLLESQRVSEILEQLTGDAPEGTQTTLNQFMADTDDDQGDCHETR